MLTQPNLGGVIASGNTPLAQSINDVATIFGGPAGLWNAGQAAPALDAIKLHLNPKEKTIFILVTDGDQNCTPFTLGMSTGRRSSGVTSGDDAAALGAAAAAQKLYSPDTVANKGNGANGGSVNADGTINGDPAASVTTYLVAYGTGAAKSPLRLDRVGRLRDEEDVRNLSAGRTPGRRSRRRPSATRARPASTRSWLPTPTRSRTCSRR